METVEMLENECDTERCNKHVTETTTSNNTSETDGGVELQKKRNVEDPSKLAGDDILIKDTIENGEVHNEILSEVKKQNSIRAVEGNSDSQELSGDVVHLVDIVIDNDMEQNNRKFEACEVEKTVDGLEEKVDNEKESCVPVIGPEQNNISDNMPVKQNDDVNITVNNGYRDSSKKGKYADSSSSESDSDADIKVVHSAPESEDEGVKTYDCEKRPYPTIKTKGELTLADLPPIEELHITVGDDVQMEEVGKVFNIVGVLVIVQSQKDVPALDENTILFVEGRKVLGQVHETFGPVSQPLYQVRFNTVEEIEQRGIEAGQKVYHAPGHAEFTRYVFLSQLQRLKGSDASWEHNNEPPTACIDFSDDEEEKRAKAKNRHRKDDIDNDSTDKGSWKSEGGRGRKKRAGAAGRSAAKSDWDQPAQSDNSYLDGWPPKQRELDCWPPQPRHFKDSSFVNSSFPPPPRPPMSHHLPMACNTQPPFLQPPRNFGPQTSGPPPQPAPVPQPMMLSQPAPPPAAWSHLQPPTNTQFAFNATANSNPRPIFGMLGANGPSFSTAPPGFAPPNMVDNRVVQNAANMLPGNPAQPMMQQGQMMHQGPGILPPGQGQIILPPRPPMAPMFNQGPRLFQGQQAQGPQWGQGQGHFDQYQR